MEERSTSGGFVSTDSTLSPGRTELTALNGNAQTFDSSMDLELLILNLLIIIITLVGLAGNAVVLWFLGFHMQKNAFSVYIFNLTGADFLYLYFRFIYSLICVIDMPNFIPWYMPDTVGTMISSTYIAGLSFLSVISTERCLSVLFHARHHCHQPNNVSALLCVVLWALSLTLSMLNQKYCYDFYLCPKFGFITVAWLIFLFVLLSVTSLTLLVSLCVSKRIQLTRQYVTIGFTVLVFLLCSLPWAINWSLTYWIYYDYNVFSYEFNRPAFILTCVQSCAKPIIYFSVGSFRQQKWHRRQNLELVLRRALQDACEVDGSQGNAPLETLEMTENRCFSSIGVAD